MAFEDRQNELYERAARIEEMEGTIKLVYKEERDDIANYEGGASKRFLILAIVLTVVSLGLLIWGILEHLYILIAIASGVLFMIIFTAAMFARGIFKIKSQNDAPLDDVELAFNSYGVVFHMCNDIRTAVYAYEWKEFESITEYEKVLVGIKQNIAYIFPKRVFSEEEYNRFRRFSHAAIGTKCIYKNFKP